MSNRFLHLLNLDTVGGVEELFMHFLAHSTTISSAQHHLLITGPKPHPFFQGRLNSLSASQTLEKYAYGIKIPKPLRSLKRKQALLTSQPHITVLWNRIEAIKKIQSRSKIVYYEHGASWIAPKSDRHNAFFSEVDQLLVNSFAAKRVVELKWNVRAPITIVHNPLKPTMIAAAEPKQPVDTSKRPFVIGFIGRLIPLKGVPLLLHALHHLVKWQIPVTCLIAGDGPSKPALEKEIKRLNLTNHVSFLGCIQDVSSFYDKIDALVIPSIREPLGLVAQEAALHGCPVIASYVDGLPEVVHNEQTGFTIPQTLDITHYSQFGGENTSLPDLVYDPSSDTLREPKLVNPATLAEKLLMLIQDPERYVSYSKQAILSAKLRPTFRQYAEELIKILG